MMDSSKSEKEGLCLALCVRGGFEREAWRLAVAGNNKKAQAAVEKKWGERLCYHKHPLEALFQAKSNLERHCIMRLVLMYTEDVVPPPEAHLMLTRNFCDLNFVFGDRMRTTLKALPERTAFTYQFVQKQKARQGDEEKKNRCVVNGEMVRRVFISFANTSSALRFVDSWKCAQEECCGMAPEEGTCLLECGTHDDTLRKWILDVDASILELKKNPRLWPCSCSSEGETAQQPDECTIRQSLHVKTMEMCQRVCNALFEMGYLHQPCHFSMTSRHSSKKMSWHVTLNALANHEQWRRALRDMESKYGGGLGDMYEFVDKSTKNNSKGQYMQVRGSTKVAAGTKGDGNCFKDIGIFDGRNGMPANVPRCRFSTLFGAATSMVIHDPWSLPFRRQEEEDSQQPQEETTPAGSSSNNKNKRKKNTTTTTTTTGKTNNNIVSSSIKKSKTEPQQVSFLKLANWDHVSSEECVWMRGLIERNDGQTKMTTIPSMADMRYMCESVSRLVNSGRGVLQVYATVLNPALCPKHLKATQKIYRHGSNNCMVAVVEESHPTCKRKSTRMFVRCFSEKCKSMVSPHCSAGGWVELGLQDYLVVRAVSSVVAEKKKQQQQQEQLVLQA